MVEKCVKMCSLDLRSFEFVDGNGFKELGQYLVNLGAKYGHLDIDSLLPHPTTISRNTIKTAKELRDKLMLKLMPYFYENRCSATTDMWTDDYKKLSYISITIHYINENWELNSNVLHVGQFPYDQKKTGDNIRNNLKQFFNQWLDNEESGDNFLSKITWVTDKGSNIIKALDRNNRLNCSAHILHNILQTTFDFTKTNSKDQLINELLSMAVDFSPIEKLISASKSLVRYMKKNGDKNLLSRPLVQHVETRWNSNLAMLRAVHDMYDELIKMYGAENRKMNDINKSLLSKLIFFLTPFKEASDQFEGTIRPTIQLVLLHRAKLLKHLNSIVSEEKYDDIFKNLAHRTLIIFKEKFKTNIYHGMALFLCPPFKKLRMVENIDERQGIIEKVKIELSKLQSNLISNCSQSEPVPIEETIQSEEDNIFSEWKDDCLPSDNYNDFNNELNIYQMESYNQNQDILQWWKEHSDKLPLMAKLASRILAIPASSAASERSFSTSGRIIEERRTRLKGDTVDSLLFLNDFFKKKM